jgi:hypothetical protein
LVNPRHSAGTSTYALCRLGRGAQVRSRVCLSWIVSDGFGDDLIEQTLVDCSCNGFSTAVGLHDDERWLEGDIEPGEDVARVVVDLREVEAVLVDEALVRLLRAGPRDADEVDLVLVLDACRLDRGGFTIARASSRRPEPERCRFPREFGGIELAATDERAGEPEDLGRIAGGFRAPVGARLGCLIGRLGHSSRIVLCGVGDPTRRNCEADRENKGSGSKGSA